MPTIRNRKQNQRGPGRPEKYPWDEWATSIKSLPADKVFVLKQGEDYDASTTSFRANCYTKFRDRGVPVSTHIDSHTPTEIEFVAR